MVGPQKTDGEHQSFIFTVIITSKTTADIQVIWAQICMDHQFVTKLICFKATKYMISGGILRMKCVNIYFITDLA